MIDAIIMFVVLPAIASSCLTFAVGALVYAAQRDKMTMLRFCNRCRREHELGSIHTLRAQGGVQILRYCPECIEAERAALLADPAYDRFITETNGHVPDQQEETICH